jgi:Fe-S-cluster-containing dehydrogenase component
MRITRKDFLRLSGLSIVAAAAVRTLQAVKGTAQSSLRIPGAGSRQKQSVMVIDLRKCRQRPGCEVCMKACKAAHNIPDIPDPRHAVKWIWNDELFAAVFPAQQNEYTRRNYSGSPLPVLCNHCDDPPCVRVCPTGATWKREDDGIVMMDWHRCIGCKYCMMACPFEARSFNFVDPRPFIAHINPEFPTRTVGLVEKCNFCEERGAKGKLPACVDACPEKAMTFGDIHDPGSPVYQALGAGYSIRRKPELGTGPNVHYIV